MKAALAVVTETRVCRGCNRELPLTEEYFRRTDFGSTWRRKCRSCAHRQGNQRLRELVAIGKTAEANRPPLKVAPRVAGEAGEESGGFTERLEDGYRWVGLPDSHGMLIDLEACEAAMAFLAFYKPVRVFLLGDHVDFAALSRFLGPPDERRSYREDIAAARLFLAKVRKYAPEAAIVYLKGNHEARLQKYLWAHAGALDKAEGMSVPEQLHLGDLNIEWEESGARMVTPRLLVKHGHMVRLRSGYTPMAEMERNGVSVLHGHTHRLAQIFKRNRLGLMTGVESGCLCKYDPPYMEGQLADWQQGLSFGAIDLRGSGFSAGVAPIVRGRVRFGDREISA